MAEPTTTKARSEFAVTETSATLPYWKFAEKFFLALATSGINELRQSGAHPSQNGLSSLCEKAYISYVYAVKVWDPKRLSMADPLPPKVRVVAAPVTEPVAAK